MAVGMPLKYVMPYLATSHSGCLHDNQQKYSARSPPSADLVMHTLVFSFFINCGTQGQLDGSHVWLMSIALTFRGLYSSYTWQDGVHQSIFSGYGLICTNLSLEWHCFGNWPVWDCVIFAFNHLRVEKVFVFCSVHQIAQKAILECNDFNMDE